MSPPLPPRTGEFMRRRRMRNLALGGALLGIVVIFYLVTIVRIGLTH